MRIVSVFGAARKREATPQQQAKFWGAILLLLFVLRLLLTLSTVFRPSSLSLSQSLLHSVSVAGGAQTLPLPKFHL